MLRLKRWIAATLAACLMINTIPVYAFEEMDESISTVETTSEVPEASAAEQSASEVIESSPVEQSASEVIEPSPVEQSASEVIEPFSTEQSTSEAEEPTPEVTQTTQTSQEIQQEMSTLETEYQEKPTQESESQETTSKETENTDPPQETGNIDPSQEAQESMELLLTLEEAIEEPVLESAGEGETQLAGEGEITDLFAIKFIKVLSENGYSDVITQDENNVTLTIGEGQGEILALLSQQEQTQDSNYQDWNIDFNFTGELPLPDTFQGLGDWGESQEEQLPFKGKFTNQAITIKTSKTLFKALDASADLHGNSIKWEIGTNDATPPIPILANVLVADGEACTINMPLASANRFNPYIGKLVGGEGVVTLPTLNYANVGTSPAVEYPGDVGIVCGSMAGGTNLKVRAVTFPSISLNLKSSKNVGSLVGSMGEGAKLTITEDMTLNATLNGTNAGGLVGSMTNATIDVEEGKTVTVNATLTATDAAGGIAGIATTETGPLGANSNVVLQSVKANGDQNSGVLYGTCTATGNLNPLTGVSFGATREVSGPGNCGGLFGTLTLEGSGKCTLSGTAESKLDISTSLTSAANTTAYGGLVGKLTGARANALIVENCTITSTISVGTETAKYPKYLGGIVAKQETATVDAKNSTITVKSPKTATATDYGFGGVTAYLGDNALLIADGMKIITDSYSANPGGGGVVGSAHKRSIVYLKTSLDLSECQLSINATSGQIVGSQDCSLIYAPGVAITRLNDTVDGKLVKGMELDDIGNYGELYRINSEDPNDSSKKAFLSIGEDYDVTFNYQLTKGDTGYTLSSKEDYACLALAWQSRGHFPTVRGITKETWDSQKATFKGSTIHLTNNIDLTSCGIGGLTRDVYDSKNPDTDTFTGTFNGNGKTLTLDIGAQNAVNDVTYGDGRIYWHNATGLFAAIDNKATVNKLTLAGSIRLSNNKLTSAMSCGALAAQVTTSANASNSMLTAVSTKVNFDVICSGSNYILYLGGLFGQISAGYKTKIDFGSGTTLAPKISITYNKYCTGSYNHFGGAIGAISGNGAVEISCNGATIGGASNQGGNNPYNMYAGGLIGTIWSGNTTRSITIKDLTVDQFTVTGSASERMGGILGGIWADTDVTIDGLTVTNTTLTASGAAELGGLVYRASGKWSVSSVDLSGLTIRASSASALGLLVCHGEPYTEPINGPQKVGGLYLEMTEHWAWNADLKKGYNIPSNITFGSGVFDEFVAYTAYRYSDGSYDITHNGSGIISLTTGNGTVNMTSGERNTYVNRTTVGQSKKTNPYSRYYYNLDSIMSDLSNANDTTVDSAQELLIWSVCRYADSSLRKHFKTKGISELWKVKTIGGTDSENPVSFDMNGLSYYPIDITNEDITVQNANVEFYNDKIETLENGNKSTRGIDSNSESPSHTQHYMMHASLFRDFKAENITQSTEYKMTVNGVTFAGTVGVVNGGSGALLCGNVAGQALSGNTSVCKVILADADNEGKAVTLNEISVKGVGENGYAPVLINKIGDYSELSAMYITTGAELTSPAGSSLIGDVGSETASKLTVTFGGTIKLPEQKSGEGQVFTKATLLNSLRYATGSAIYNFAKEKDFNPNYVHNATHGRELGKAVSVEYSGQLGKYLKSDTFVSKNEISETHFYFSSDLPYVALSPATQDGTHTVGNKWHELAVNLPSTDLTEGCGTYGHPYQVNGSTFRAVANFVNGGAPAEGWKVCVPNTPSTYHSSAASSDLTLKYENGIWKDVTDNENVVESTYTTEAIRTHLQSAYYQLSENMELSNFNGIGATIDTAFKGVIDGNGTTITLSGTSEAFIKYSYGSVVRDVNFTLLQMPTLTWKDPGRTASNTTRAQQAPSTFFGGVIGCVLGGDNIIENVEVSTGYGFSVTPSGSNPHLVSVGGYVGVIAGGGVLFRGTYSSNTGITGTDAQLYRNPIIGRVLGGYAFYEGDGTAPDNGNKNYKINKITPVAEGVEKDLSWDESTLTVNTAQGLLILSAIVSSGAGSTESNAYKNGVARNATYKEIGAASEPADYATAKNEGTISYLSSYVSVTGEGNSIDKICTSSTEGITIKFAKKDNNTPLTFDMTDYDNGYRGLSARYVSNAAFSGSTVTPSAVVMRVKTFDGQNTTVTGINMDVKEYNNDDFHMASMGGIFNIVWTQKQSGGGGDGSNFAQNLTLTNCNVSLKYVDSSGAEKNEADTNTFAREDGMRAVSVGGFIGMANDIDASNNSQKTLKHNYLFSNIHIRGNSDTDRCAIVGPNSAGSLIGATAMASTSVKEGYPGKLLANGKWALFGPSFLNCSYSDITVTGGLAAGGLIGDAYTNDISTIPNFSGLGMQYLSKGEVYLASYTSCTVTDKDLIVGQNATITASAKSSIAGGLFGGAGMRVGVNDPEVNTKSGITTVNNVSNIRTLQLLNVRILVSTTDYDPGVADRADNGINNAYAAGIIGRIGNVNPSCFYDISINGGGVASTKATSSRVGGIQGSGYTNSEITMERCEISSYTLSGANTGGFLGNGQDPPGFKLNMSDCKLENSTVSGTETAGGLVGDAKSLYYLHNILIKNTSITSTKNAGRLFGKMTVGDNFGVYAAGISVYANKEGIQIPAKDGSADSFNGYIAYADYAGTETEVTGYKSPYVTRNPNYPLVGTDKMLTGDAVGKIEGDTEYNSVAARIWADNKTGATGKKNLASYANASTIVNAAGKTAPEVSTFREVQGYTAENWGELADLPVLVLKGNDASTIEDYLNVITNGGYGVAKASGKITIDESSVSVYYFNKDQKTFSLATEQLTTNPASIYYENGQFHIRSRSFDNTLNRFSLVEVSFKVKINGVDRTYTVSVPVVVIRELQYNFMATFSYGREFQKNTFADLRTHLLESTGNPFTAYLTYQYNREKGQYVEYDWQSYMDDGGSMLDVDKVLSFSSGLPDGTQMILLDCQNGNQAYQYTTSEAGTKDVKLSNFTSLTDSNITFKSSMADILGVTASEPIPTGKFVETTAADGTVRLNGTYYRPYNSDKDSGKDRYDLTVPDLSKKVPEENYYLVITVPTQESNPNYYINGSLSSSLKWSMPSSGTQLHRYDPTKVDDRNNTESTYQISTGYRQSLVSTASVNTVDLGNTDQKMQVKVQDTITFSNRQTYDANDKLFLKLTANLQEYTSAEGNAKSEEKQFPVGTTGTVKFYVQNGDTYYTWDGTKWVSQTSKTEAASYDWASNGGNMELLLSNDGTNALDLSGVRQMIKGMQSSGDSQIIVTAEMDINFGSAEVLNAAVPGSENNGTDTWTKLHYLGQISTQEISLSYSAMRATAADNAKYYRSVRYQAVLSMDAMQIDQLGVNPLQLVQDYQENIGGKNASRINLTAALNLANLQDIESVLKNTENITFTLSLQRRQGDNYVDVENASNYIAFHTGWSWTIPKNQYYNNGAIVTNDIFDGKQFTFPITAYVFTDQTGYANYMIKLTVSFGENSSVSVTDTDAYVVYTFACIKPSFYEPQSGGATP